MSIWFESNLLKKQKNKKNKNTHRLRRKALKLKRPTVQRKYKDQRNKVNNMKKRTKEEFVKCLGELLTWSKTSKTANLLN